MNNPNDVVQNKHLDALAARIAGNIGGNDFVGATASIGGASGLVPKPNAGDNEKFLRGDGTWALPTVSGGGSGGSSTAYNPAAYGLFKGADEQIGSVPVNECTRLAYAQTAGFPTETQNTYRQQFYTLADYASQIYNFFWFDIPAHYKTSDFQYTYIDFTCEKTVSKVLCNGASMSFYKVAGIQYYAKLTEFGLVAILVDA